LFAGPFFPGIDPLHQLGSGLRHLPYNLNIKTSPGQCANVTPPIIRVQRVRVIRVEDVTDDKRIRKIIKVRRMIIFNYVAVAM
jgi:hypothetical protein